ncbi:Cytochrome c class I [Candidatus Glomeribacter gigasporarum BEG34]|uniref:Cytochrome c class I n=1 Tax=Candidatus Glomeribacter gigasporarum BEG34 TaxID=1070319 RepID=G2J8V8_9BURK|nr:c-type cytochrome [Candidatus Glomeribacter gigasporarum]CCD29205.1 Cytochrome c class I [Candidatus Glomeribacter gigasporarum BEG34]
MKSRGFATSLFRALLAYFAFCGAVAFCAFCAAQTRAAQPKAPDTMAARVKACAICHGQQGEGTHNDYFPRLAGKPAGYLAEQIRNFREGRRNYPPMNDLVAYLSDDYLDEIAVYYSKLRPPRAPFAPFESSVSASATPSRLARGRMLAQKGDAEKGIPACIACHHQTLAGMQPSIPGLLGLSADYIRAQLGAWRSGARRAASPDCMQAISARLSDEDISATAYWLSMQPYNPDLAPAPAGSVQLPLQCGSAPH